MANNPSAIDIAYDDIVNGHREQNEFRVFAGVAALAHSAASDLAAIRAHVGRLADAAERIADKLAPVKPPEPKRDFIGMQPE